MQRMRYIAIVAVGFALAIACATAIAIAGGKAATQITLAPNWGNYQAMAGVKFVENINVRLFAPDDKPIATIAQARDEYRKAFAAYKAAGAEVGFYLTGDILDGPEPYYPATGLTADPRWLWGSVRFARKGGVPIVAPFELGGIRWTIDRSHAPTLTRVAQRAKVLLRERIADSGVRPDFIFFDNCGLKINGGADDLDTFLGYAETVADGVGLPFMVNVSATPDLWTAAEWDAVAFTSETLRSQGRWLGFAFETALRPVMLGTGTADAVELAAFRKLLDLRCRAVWDVGLSVPDGAEAAQKRLAAAASELRRDGDELMVGCHFFRPAPTWAVR